MCAAHAGSGAQSNRRSRGGRRSHSVQALGAARPVPRGLRISFSGSCLKSRLRAWPLGCRPGYGRGPASVQAQAARTRRAARQHALAKADSDAVATASNSGAPVLIWAGSPLGTFGPCAKLTNPSARVVIADTLWSSKSGCVVRMNFLQICPCAEMSAVFDAIRIGLFLGRRLPRAS